MLWMDHFASSWFHVAAWLIFDFYSLVIVFRHFLSFGWGSLYLLQKTLSSLELPGVVSVASSSTNASVDVSPTLGNQVRADGSAYDSNISLQSLRRQRNKANDPAKDLSIQVLEKFSLVTKFARETTSQLFGENNGEQFFTNDLKKPSHSQSLPDLHSTSSSNDLEEVPCEAPVPADPMEVYFIHSPFILLNIPNAQLINSEILSLLFSDEQASLYFTISGQS